MNLPPEWLELSAEEARGFEKELAQEVCPEHDLANISTECIARRDGRDDFLFRVDLDGSEYVVVHLTWSRERSPDWPWTTPFTTVDDFKANWRKIFG